MEATSVNVVQKAGGLEAATDQAALGGRCRVWLAGGGLSISPMASTPMSATGVAASHKSCMPGNTCEFRSDVVHPCRAPDPTRGAPVCASSSGQSDQRTLSNGLLLNRPSLS